MFPSVTGLQEARKPGPTMVRCIARKVELGVGDPGRGPDFLVRDLYSPSVRRVGTCLIVSCAVGVEGWRRAPKRFGFIRPRSGEALRNIGRVSKGARGTVRDGEPCDVGVVG